AAAAPRPTSAARQLTGRRIPNTTTPAGKTQANTWTDGSTELGALLCTARAPKCDQCPVQQQCAWFATGQPELTTKPKSPSWKSTDRQVRGAIMGVLRAQGSIDIATLQTTVEATGRLGQHIPQQPQWNRAIDGLVSDGLATRTDQTLGLPG